MRILAIQPFVTGDGINSFSGGKSRAAVLLAEYLQQRGHTLAILPFPEILGTQVSFQMTADCVTPVYPTIAFPNRREVLPAAWRALTSPRSPKVRAGALLRTLFSTSIERALQAFKPDLIHSHQTISIFPDLIASFRGRAPILLTHTHGIGNRLEAYDWIVFPSHYQQQELVGRSPVTPERSSVIHYPVHPAFLETEPAAERDGFVFAGALKPRKGLDLLLEAYRLDPALNDHRLHICGDGPLRATFESFSKEHRLNVVFHGKVTAHELAPLLSRAALMVTPSREESFGIVYQESLCSGTPFIGYPPTVRELESLWDLKVGLPFDANTQSASDLAALIHRGLADEMLSAPYRRRLLTTARAFSTVDRYGESYERCYASLVEGRSGVRG